MNAQTSPSTESLFLDAFRRSESTNGAAPILTRMRQAAADQLKEFGLPKEKEEAWKYTNIRRRLNEFSDVEPAGAGAVDTQFVMGCAIPDLDAHRAVLVNGMYRADLSSLDALPGGVRVCGLAEAATEHSALVERHLGSTRPEGHEGLVALNTAFLRDGLFIHVTAGTVLERPIEVILLSTGDERTFVQPRLLCVAESRSEVRVVESWRRTGRGIIFTNAVAEWVVAEGASADHVRIIEEGDSDVHVHSLQARQTGSGHFATSTITLTGGTVRNNAYFLPDAEYCETFLNGFYLGQGSTHIDNHTLVDHARPNCESNELYKGILDDRSTGVFNGKVLVREDSQKTNAYQSNKSVILTETARMYSKPELEIYADDVKCSHGATTGELDSDAMFYLRSRGIRPAAARMLLLQAFASDVLGRIREPAVRTYVTERISALLHN